MNFVDELAQRHADAHAAEVERRLMAGENRVVIGNYAYVVPGWTERPFRRLRIEWLRRRWRLR